MTFRLLTKRFERGLGAGLAAGVFAAVCLGAQFSVAGESASDSAGGSIAPAVATAAAPALPDAAGDAQLAQADPGQQSSPVRREIQRGETVRGRPHPEYDPVGLPLGGFRIYPELVVAPTFDDNVFRTEDDKSADLVTVTSPTVAVRSNWANHELNFEAGADIGFYIDNDSEDFEDYHAAMDGRLDVTRDTSMSAALDAAHLHQGRGDPDDPVGAAEPTEFDRFQGTLRGDHRMGRFTGTLAGALRRFDYEDVPTRTSGLPDINNDDRDHNQYEGSAQLSYEIVPDYDAFVRGTTTMYDFDDALDDTGIDRNRQSYEAVAGVAIDFGGIIFGDFFAGYLVSEPEDDSLETIDGLLVGADITWNVTRLTTVTGTVDREVTNTTSAGAAGALSTTVGVQVDHELLRNLIISLNLSGNEYDYEGIDRTDYNIVGGVAADYLINRNFFVGALFEHRDRLSDGDAQSNDYSVNLIGVRAGTQF